MTINADKKTDQVFRYEMKVPYESWGDGGAGVNGAYLANDCLLYTSCYDKHMAKLVEEGKISMQLVDDAVKRVFRIKFRLGLFDNPYTCLLYTSRCV